MAMYKVDEASLTAVADAIRERAGTTEDMVFPDGFVSVVGELVNPENYLAAVMNLEVVELVNSLVTSITPLFQANNSKLKRVDLAQVATLGEKAFYKCSALETVNLPLVQSIGPQVFGDCNSLTVIYLPSLKTIEGWGFNFAYCANLVKVHLPQVTNLTANEFAGCSKLSTIILGSDSICSLPNTNAFDGTPIANGTGYIYVPSALVDSYKAATNWSTYASQIRAIEDYPEITGG